MITISQSDLIPLTVHELKLFAPAQVNQTNTLAYLDTGANRVTLSPKLAENLPRAGTIRVGSAFEQKSFDAVENVEINFLGHTHYTNARVNQISDSILPFNSDVTLDAPTIFAQAVVFDFRVLGIMPAKQVSGDSWIELQAKFLASTELLVIYLTSRNKTVAALFDTGAGLSVVNSAHREELGLDLQPAFELVIADAVGAKTTQKVFVCGGLCASNDVILPPFDCFSVDLQAIEKALGCRIDMVFGANAMLKSGFTWLIDKPEGKVYFGV